MLKVTITNTETDTTSSLDIRLEDAPSLRSAIDEIRNEVGGRLVGSHRFPKEAALTRAVRALGRLAAGINFVVPEEDPDYA